MFFVYNIVIGKNNIKQKGDMKMIEKIQKLLAKAESTNSEAEAQAFLMKAQELMAKHGISQSEVEIKEDKEPEITSEVVTDNRATATRNLKLANLIAKNFKCEVLLARGKGNNQIKFFGFEDDVKIASQTFKAIHTFMERRRRQIYKAALKEGKNTKGLREAYTEGLIKGLEEGFKRNVTELGLMVITPEAVKKAVMKNTTGTHSIKSKSPVDMETFTKGYKDGKGFGREVE